MSSRAVSGVQVEEVLKGNLLNQPTSVVNWPLSARGMTGRSFSGRAGCGVYQTRVMPKKKPGSFLWISRSRVGGAQKRARHRRFFILIVIGAP